MAHPYIHDKFIGPSPLTLVPQTVHLKDAGNENLFPHRGGYWISPNGEIYLVRPETGHLGVAMAMGADCSFTSNGEYLSTYDILKRVGFIHITFCDSTFAADWSDNHITVAALRAMAKLMEHYETRYDRVDIYAEDLFNVSFRSGASMSKETWESVYADLRRYTGEVSRRCLTNKSAA